MEEALMLSIHVMSCHVIVFFFFFRRRRRCRCRCLIKTVAPAHFHLSTQLLISYTTKQKHTNTRLREQTLTLTQPYNACQTFSARKKEWNKERGTIKHFPSCNHVKLCWTRLIIWLLGSKSQYLIGRLDANSAHGKGVIQWQHNIDKPNLGSNSTKYFDV